LKRVNPVVDEFEYPAILEVWMRTRGEGDKVATAGPVRVRTMGWRGCGGGDFVSLSTEAESGRGTREGMRGREGGRKGAGGERSREAARLPQHVSKTQLEKAPPVARIIRLWF